MQIGQLENPAQETPGPSTTLNPTSAPPQPLPGAQHSQPGTASGESSHTGQLQNAENESSRSKGNKEIKPTPEGQAAHTI